MEPGLNRMNCSEIENILDDYLEHFPGEGLDDAKAAAVALHIQGCLTCARELEQRQALRRDLQALAMPAPAAGFLEQAVANAAASAETSAVRTEQTVTRRQPFGTRLTSVVTGLAAAMIGALLISTLLTSPEPRAPETTLQGIHLATNTVTPVKLAFSSETALEDARLTLSLPVGVELMGYDGRTDLSWNTDLEAGTNVLRLPLVGRMAASDVLVARLEHPSGAKTFRLPVTVNE